MDILSYDMSSLCLAVLSPLAVIVPGLGCIALGFVVMSLQALSILITGSTTHHGTKRTMATRKPSDSITSLCVQECRM